MDKLREAIGKRLWHLRGMDTKPIVDGIIADVRQLAPRPAPEKIAQAICNKMNALNLRLGDKPLAGLIHVREFMAIAEAVNALPVGEDGDAPARHS